MSDLPHSADELLGDAFVGLGVRLGLSIKRVARPVFRYFRLSLAAVVALMDALAPRALESVRGI